MTTEGLSTSSLTRFVFPLSLPFGYLPRRLFIHVQYTETESIRLKHLTIRLDSHVTCRLDSHGARLANRLPAWRIDNRGNDSCRFDRIESNRQHFQPTLHSPPEVKIREITIHEPSSFLKRGHKLQSIRTIRVDSIESTRIDNIFNPPSKSTSTIFLAQIDFRHVESTEGETIRVDSMDIGFTNRFPIANTKDESTLRSWVYCTTINGAGKCHEMIVVSSLLGKNTLFLLLTKTIVFSIIAECHLMLTFH